MGLMSVLKKKLLKVKDKFDYNKVYWIKLEELKDDERLVFVFDRDFSSEEFARFKLKLEEYKRMNMGECIYTNLKPKIFKVKDCQLGCENDA